MTSTIDFYGIEFDDNESYIIELLLESLREY